LFIYAIRFFNSHLNFLKLSKTVIKLREFLRDKPRVSFAFAVMIGILVNEFDAGVQRLLLPVATYLQPLLLNADSSFAAEVAVNCIFQGLIALGVCLIVAPFFASALRPQSMFYPLVAVGADLIYSSWWMPISIYTNKWPFPNELRPIYLLSTFLTSAIFLGTLTLASKKALQQGRFNFWPAVMVGNKGKQQLHVAGATSIQAATMDNNNPPTGRLSTRYLLLMVSFVPGALVTIDGLRFAMAHGLTLVVVIKVGFCLFLFAACCIAINNRNYFNDLVQRKYLTTLSLSFGQTILAFVILLFWGGLKVVLFGSK
jgi:hypothetical protein